MCDIGVIDKAIGDGQGVYYFSKVGCKYCKNLEDELDNLKVPYIKYVLDPADGNYTCVATYLKEKTGMNSFPMLYIGKERIGGYSEFKTLEMTNTLQDKLNAIGLKIELDF